MKYSSESGFLEIIKPIKCSKCSINKCVIMFCLLLIYRHFLDKNLWQMELQLGTLKLKEWNDKPKPKDCIMTLFSDFTSICSYALVLVLCKKYWGVERLSIWCSFLYMMSFSLYDDNVLHFSYCSFIKSWLISNIQEAALDTKWWNDELLLLMQFEKRYVWLGNLSGKVDIG